MHRRPIPSAFLTSSSSPRRPESPFPTCLRSDCTARWTWGPFQPANFTSEAPCLFASFISMLGAVSLRCCRGGWRRLGPHATPAPIAVRFFMVLLVWRAECSSAGKQWQPDTMATKLRDTEYLKTLVGDALSRGCAAAAISLPNDPVEYLGQWLLRCKWFCVTSDPSSWCAPPDRLPFGLHARCRHVKNAEVVGQFESEKEAALNTRKTELVCHCAHIKEPSACK